MSVKKHTLRLTIILLIAVSVFYAAYTWHKAVQAESSIPEELWYGEREFSRMIVRDAYDLAFKKIILVDGIIFASAFLLLYTSSREKNI